MSNRTEAFTALAIQVGLKNTWYDPSLGVAWFSMSDGRQVGISDSLGIEDAFEVVLYEADEDAICDGRIIGAVGNYHNSTDPVRVFADVLRRILGDELLEKADRQYRLDYGRASQIVEI